MMAIDPFHDERPAARVERRTTASRSAAHDVPDHLAIPRERAVAETRDRVGMIAALLVCSVIAVFVVNRYAALTQMNYQLQNMRATLSHQTASDAALQEKMYELSSPVRILGIAENILKMKPANPVVVGTKGN